MNSNKSIRCCTRSSNMIKRPKRLMDDSFDWSASFYSKKVKVHLKTQRKKDNTKIITANSLSSDEASNKKPTTNFTAKKVNKKQSSKVENSLTDVHLDHKLEELNSQKDTDSGVSLASSSSSPSSLSSPSTPVRQECDQENLANQKSLSEPDRTRVKDNSVGDKKFKFDDLSYLNKLESSEERIRWIQKQMEKCKKAYSSMKRKLEHLESRKKSLSDGGSQAQC